MKSILASNERVLCCNCLRPQVTCYCKLVKPFSSRFQFIFLQHPLEFRKAIGTARMAYHCIQGSKLFSDIEFTHHPIVNHIINDSDNQCSILYPSQDSCDVSLLNSTEICEKFPKNKNQVLFIIDGTWSCARKVLSRSANLASLPRISITPRWASEYRIRKEPKLGYLSTIEATHQTLSILDPTANRDSLLVLFRAMVERQIQFERIHSKQFLKRNTQESLTTPLPMSSL